MEDEKPRIKEEPKPVEVEKPVEVPKPKMIELSVQIDDMMSYDISIPSVIRAETMPEVLSRLRAIMNVIPEENLEAPKRPSGNVIMSLGLEESEDIIKNYEAMSRESFAIFLKNKYFLEFNKWETLVALMGRLRRRVRNLKEKEE